MLSRTISIFVIVVTGFLLVPSAQADKSNYHLFNPTPQSLLRPLSTDRPDTTESPYTVDAGHIQIELDFFRFSTDQRKGVKEEELALLPINFKIGLSNSIDLQVIPESYVVHRSKPKNSDSTTRSGFGDTSVRLKYNFFGNDAGDSALAIMPYLTIPTARNHLGADRLEGGLILPFGYSLAENLGLGLMVEWDYVNQEYSKYRSEFLTSATLGYDITSTFGSYVEMVAILSDKSSFEDMYYLNLGTTYALSDNLQLDAGVNFGLTAATEDIAGFAGICYRL